MLGYSRIVLALLFALTSLDSIVSLALPASRNRLMVRAPPESNSKPPARSSGAYVADVADRKKERRPRRGAKNDRLKKKAETDMLNKKAETERLSKVIDQSNCRLECRKAQNLGGRTPPKDSDEWRKWSTCYTKCMRKAGFPDEKLEWE